MHAGLLCSFMYMILYMLWEALHESFHGQSVCVFLCMLPGLVKVFSSVGHSTRSAKPLTQRSSGHIHKLLLLLARTTHRNRKKKKNRKHEIQRMDKTEQRQSCCQDSSYSLCLAVLRDLGLCKHSVINVCSRGERSGGQTISVTQQHLCHYVPASIQFVICVSVFMSLYRKYTWYDLGNVNLMFVLHKDLFFHFLANHSEIYLATPLDGLSTQVGNPQAHCLCIHLVQREKYSNCFQQEDWNNPRSLKACIFDSWHF